MRLRALLVPLAVLVACCDTVAASSLPVTPSGTTIAVNVDSGSILHPETLPLSGAVAGFWLLLVFLLTRLLGTHRRLWLSQSLVVRLWGQQSGDNPARSPDAIARKSLVVAGVSLALVPVLLVLGIDHYSTFPLPIAAILACWLATGTAGTARQWWLGAGGLALAPIVAMVSMTPTVGPGSPVLLWIVGAGLLWTPTGVALFMLGQRISTPSRSTSGGAPK